MGGVGNYHQNRRKKGRSFILPCRFKNVQEVLFTCSVLSLAQFFRVRAVTPPTGHEHIRSPFYYHRLYRCRYKAPPTFLYVYTKAPSTRENFSCTPTIPTPTPKSLSTHGNFSCGATFSARQQPQPTPAGIKSLSILETLSITATAPCWY